MCIFAPIVFRMGAAQFGGGGEGNALSWVTPPTAYRLVAAMRRSAFLVWQEYEVGSSLVTISMFFSIKRKLKTLIFINTIC